MKLFIKELLRESLLTESNYLNENILGKSLVAAIMLTMNSMSGQMKAEFKKQIDSIQKVTTLTPQEKRAEIQKIVQLNRSEITGKKHELFLRNMAAAGFTDEEKYKQYLEKLAKQPDAQPDNLQSPTFKSTNCGVSKAAAKQSKKDFKEK